MKAKIKKNPAKNVIWMATLTLALLAPVFFSLSSFAQNVPKEYPDAGIASKVRSKASSIAAESCKNQNNNNDDCKRRLSDEYVTLAERVCGSKNSKSAKTSCYNDFLDKNTSVGKARAAAGLNPNQSATSQDSFFGNNDGKYQCGSGESKVTTRFDFGCIGGKPGAPQNMSPIEDLVYAFVRFLSYGVGLAVIVAIIYSGIQYSMSEGNAEKTQAAKNHIREAVFGLFIYLFAFALVQYLVPGGVFSGSIYLNDYWNIIRI